MSRPASDRPRRLRAMLRALAGLIVSLPAALSGCSWFSATVSSAPAASCPSAVILRPLAQTAIFAPNAAHQPMGVAFYGILSDVDAKCERVGDAVRAALDVVVVGERGPAASKAEELELQYFVAVTGADQAILSKRSFPVHIAIAADARRSGVTDHIEETIPLGGRSPGDLSIVIGFQQGPEIVDFYQHFRGR
jgi:hypothetical protein